MLDGNRFTGILLTLVLAASAVTAVASGRLLPMEKRRDQQKSTPNKVQRHSLGQARPTRSLLSLERDKPWSLPRQALSVIPDTFDILVLRFDFQEEIPDDPNTTGNGLMDMSNPNLSPEDSAAYYNSVEHWVDPPPHNTSYFNSHMKALRSYWETVSEGRITLSWKIYPEDSNSTYKLPRKMSEYGICHLGLPADVAFDTVIFGLEEYFRDCFRTVEAIGLDTSFAAFDSYFLFHAGSDRQNDIGFPETCSDLFTGFINYVPRDTVPDDTVWVDGGMTMITEALLLPETTNQDNRATALNAVIAHEFGHQLGLIDLYRTDYFITCLGDFALMDHNGFSTAIDLGYAAGRIFGAFPIYPSAWSRAYLGFVEIKDYRAGTDIEVVAAEVISDGTKIARIPISEHEYYLIENRVVNPDNRPNAMFADSNWVFQYPADSATGDFKGEYDFLIPGSGLLIYHVDEGVTGLDYNGDGVSNFDDNKLQWDPSRKFVKLVEADGIVDMSGYYEIGMRKFGCEEDMFRDDRQRSFTPNTNPASIDNSGNNTHVRMTDIGRLRVFDSGRPRRNDSVISFDLETEKLVHGFPVRAGSPVREGYPVYGFSPVVDDLDRDGNPEIIFASVDNLCVVTPAGDNFLHQVSECDPICVTYHDSAFASVHSGMRHPIPLYFRTPVGFVTANPVTGDFGMTDSCKYVAVGSVSGGAGRVDILKPADVHNNGQADQASSPSFTSGIPIAMSFGNSLYVLTDRGQVHFKSSLRGQARKICKFDEEAYHGLIRIGDALIVLAGDTLVDGWSTQTRLHYVTATDSGSYTLDGYYNLGPILVDVNLDSLPEVVAFSPEGKGIYVTVDTTLAVPPNAVPVFSILAEKETGFDFTVNPIAGDVDLDGYPEIVIGGTNAVYAFNRELTLVTDFPIEVNDRYPDDPVLFSPVIADLERGGRPEIVFPSLVGNIYSFGPDLSYGFPLSGGEAGIGSPVAFTDTSGGKLGYLGADGWFYLWQVDRDTTNNFWPMYGCDPSGNFVFDKSKLGKTQQYAKLFPEEKFYNYPNPVIDGVTTIRYFLAKEASRVELTIYSLSGREITRFAGKTSGGIDNEEIWDCSDVTPGVYRCVIEVDFGEQTEHAFTDIAIIR